MPTWLTLLIAISAVMAIFLTTPAGRRLARAMRIDALAGADAAPPEDREFLLRVCDGDKREVARRLDAERQKNPDMTEAQVYRKAIRTHMNRRAGESE